MLILLSLSILSSEGKGRGDTKQAILGQKAKRKITHIHPVFNNNVHLWFIVGF